MSKVTNPKHLELLRYMGDNYFGIHPRNGTGEVNFDVIDLVPTTNKIYPRIMKMRIIKQWFWSKVLVWVQVGDPEVDFANSKVEMHRMEISHKDIRELFPKLSQLACEQYKKAKAEAQAATKKNLNLAVDNFMKCP